MDPVLQALLVLGVLALVVWLKVVRPLRGDRAWARQGERIARARTDRLARRRTVVPPPRPS